LYQSENGYKEENGREKAENVEVEERKQKTWLDSQKSRNVVA